MTLVDDMLSLKEGLVHLTPCKNPILIRKWEKGTIILSEDYNCSNSRANTCTECPDFAEGEHLLCSKPITFGYPDESKQIKRSAVGFTWRYNDRVSALST